jgi:hypothetical protein
MKITNCGWSTNGVARAAPGGPWVASPECVHWRPRAELNRYGLERRQARCEGRDVSRMSSPAAGSGDM